MIDPQERTPTTCKQNLAYLTLPELGSNSQQWDSGEMSDIEPGPPRFRIKQFSYKIRISDKNVKMLRTLSLVLTNMLSNSQLQTHARSSPLKI